MYYYLSFLPTSYGLADNGIGSTHETTKKFNKGSSLLFLILETIGPLYYLAWVFKACSLMGMHIFCLILSFHFYAFSNII